MQIYICTTRFISQNGKYLLGILLASNTLETFLQHTFAQIDSDRVGMQYSNNVTVRATKNNYIIKHFNLQCDWQIS